MVLLLLEDIHLLDFDSRFNNDDLEKVANGQLIVALKMSSGELYLLPTSDIERRKINEVFVTWNNQFVFLEDHNALYAFVYFGWHDEYTASCLDGIAAVYEDLRGNGNSSLETEMILWNNTETVIDITLDVPLLLQKAHSVSPNCVSSHGDKVPSMLNTLQRALGPCNGDVGSISLTYIQTNLEIRNITDALNAYNSDVMFADITQPTRYIGCILIHDIYKIKYKEWRKGHANFLFWDLQLDRIFWIEPHGSNKYRRKTYFLKSTPYIVEQFVSLFVLVAANQYKTIEDLSQRPCVKRHIQSLTKLTTNNWDTWKAFCDNEVTFLGHVESDGHEGLGFQHYLTRDEGYCVSIAAVTYYILVRNCERVKTPEDYTRLLIRLLLWMMIFKRLDEFIEEVSNGLSENVESQGYNLPKVDVYKLGQ